MTDTTTKRSLVDQLARRDPMEKHRNAGITMALFIKSESELTSHVVTLTPRGDEQPYAVAFHIDGCDISLHTSQPVRLVKLLREAADRLEEVSRAKTREEVAV